MMLGTGFIEENKCIEAIGARVYVMVSACRELRCLEVASGADDTARDSTGEPPDACLHAYVHPP